MEQAWIRDGEMIVSKAVFDDRIPKKKIAKVIEDELMHDELPYGTNGAYHNFNDNDSSFEFDDRCPKCCIKKELGLGGEKE